METDDEMFGKMEELDIANAIKNKDVPYVIAQIKGLIGESKASERVAFGKAILDLLKQMEEEPHAEENTENIYTIGYLTALSRAELEIEKLIEKVEE